MSKFVDEWNIVQTLGEGAYGEVKLLVHETSGEAVAMKVIDTQKCKDVKETVIKEERLHRLLTHPNIISFLGKRTEPNAVYIFLEYAAGGELFNKIEPDVGMYAGEVQKYMKQLLDGVQYIHSKGIAHRDIKPENLLIDDAGNLKISDFGMATLFRLRGKERQLDKKCGTLPYVAPEILEDTAYRAEPADIWSCGIVFVAMMAGELPWDEPRVQFREYAEWLQGSCIMQTPWSKLDTAAFSLARKILTPDPRKRPVLSRLLEHPWMTKPFCDDEVDGSDQITSSPPSKRHHNKDEKPVVTLSQPAPRVSGSIAPERLAHLLQDREQICFSQPTQNDDLILGSQIQYTQTPLTQNNYQKLVKRMTRFFVKTSCEKTIAQLCNALDSSNYSWTSDPSGVVTVSMIDSKKMPLTFKANIHEMDGKMLLDFRLTKGCGLEFKRRFIKIKAALAEIVLPNVSY